MKYYVAGMLSGIIQCFISNPFEIYKIVMQSDR